MSRRLAWFLIACAACVYAEDARQIVTESQNRSRSKSQQYEGTLEVVNSKQKVSTKRWTFARLGSFGDSKMMLRFTEPKELNGVAVLVINHADRPSEQWLWIPAEGRDRRIATQDRSTRFFGTDFSFEDLDERDVNEFDYKLLGEDTVDGARCWKVEARPKQSKSSQYTSSLFWIRKDTYVIAKVENFAGSQLVRWITYSNIEKISGIWTPRTIEAFDSAKDSRTVLKLDRVVYNAPLNDAAFSRDALKDQ